jgi:hypothetical protein
VGYISLSFIAKFTHLQELTLSFRYKVDLDFSTLQNAIFPQLQILKFQYEYPKHELLIKFLENNGNNLKEFYVKNNGNLLNLAIAEFCPNLRKISTRCETNELEALKKIFNSCQYLESIKIWVGNFDLNYLGENNLLETIAEYSPRNVNELILCYDFEAQLELLPEELESFFISWSNRVPQKLLSFIIVCNDFSVSTLVDNDENMQVIEKYVELGIIKEFKNRV